MRSDILHSSAGTINKATAPVVAPSHAVAPERLGGLKGGVARAAALAPKKRSQIAARAAAKRWEKKP